MGNLKLVVEKVTGLAQINSACAVFSKKISLNDEANATFISCIFLKTNEEDEVQPVLGEIFELSTKKIEEAEKEDGFLKSLISARDATCDYLSAKNADLNFAYLLFYRDVCYIVRFGEKVRLLVFDPPEEEEIIIKEGSGPVKAGQIFLVATEKFLSLFDIEDFKKEAEIDLVGIIDGLATDISQEKDQSEEEGGDQCGQAGSSSKGLFHPYEKRPGGHREDEGPEDGPQEREDNHDAPDDEQCDD